MSTALVPIIAGGLGLASAYMGANAAKSAGNRQAEAAREAQAATEARYQQTRQDLLPFIQNGYGANQALRGLTGLNEGENPLTAPLTRQYTGADLENTPGYQFTRDQGLKGLYNSYAARGLGNSSAALKGGARYTTGLAQKTFNDQLQNDINQRKMTYEMLFGQNKLGAEMAGGLAKTGQEYQGATNTLMGTAASGLGGADVGAAKNWQALFNPLAQYGAMYAVNPDLFRQQTAEALRRSATGIFGPASSPASG